MGNVIAPLNQYLDSTPTLINHLECIYTHLTNNPNYFFFHSQTIQNDAKQTHLNFDESIVYWIWLRDAHIYIFHRIILLAFLFITNNKKYMILEKTRCSIA